MKKFAIPFHIAPGEAEAECALLQQKGLVDAVLSEDVDTLMFGCGLTLRTWSPEPGTGSQIRTHVNLYDAEKTKAGKSGLDRPGMILVAMMSGGDYLPEGIPGCGPKTACEAARAGFGADLCNLSRHDRAGIAAWKERLCHELKSNESKHFARKHKALVVPEEFPRKDILGYYTMPVISTDTQIEALRKTLAWDQPLDLKGLREFCGEAFDWVCVSGAKKFIRNIAPCVLVKELRLRADQETPAQLEIVKELEGHLVKGIHGRRSHKSTDGSSELRVSFRPIELVKIDLDAEDPDPEDVVDDLDADDEDDAQIEAVDPSSPKKRAASKYDPTQPEKMWLLETFVKVGVPLMAEDYQEACRQSEAAKLAKDAAKATRQAARLTAATNVGKRTGLGGMQRGALDRFTRVIKPGITTSEADSIEKSGPLALDDPFEEAKDSTAKPLEPATMTVRPAHALDGTTGTMKSTAPIFIDLLSSSEQAAPKEKRRFRRSLSDTGSINGRCPSVARSDVLSTVSKAASSPKLPASVSIRRHRSPLRRVQTLPNQQRELNESPKTPQKQCRPRPPCDIQPDELPIRSPTRLPVPAEAICEGFGSRNGTASAADVITISSSPVATPRFNRQRTITEWVSPNRQRPMKNSGSVVTMLDLSSNQEDNANVILKTLTESSTRAQPQTQQKRTVRIRESLEGSWVLEAQNKSQVTPEPKRKKNSQRIFRLSSVAVLDMTEED